MVVVLAVILASLGVYYFNEWYKSPKSKWTKYGEEDIALVTGGSRGLGAEIVGQLLLQKVQVIILDIVEPNFPGCKYYRCDLSDENEVKATIEMIISNLNKSQQHLSLLVNNAGVRHHQSLMNLTDSKINRIFQINTLSQIWLVRAIYKNHIKFYGDERLYIVSISSILGVIGPKNLSIYSASKAAIIQIFESLIQEIMLDKVRLLLVTPGQLSTSMFDDVKKSSQFIAPIVNHKTLSGKIIHQINQGKIGIILEPCYTNFIPIIKSLPISLQQFCRWLSGMDNKIIDE